VNHPVLSNYRTKAFFAGIVIVVIIIRAIIACFAFNLPVGYALTDSFLFNIIFASCVIPLWFPVYYIRWKEKAWYYNGMTHLAMIVLLLLVWLGSGYLLMHLFFGSNDIYIGYLDKSLIWKIIEGVFFYIIVVLVYFLFLANEKLEEKEKNEIRLNQLIKTGGLERIAVKDRQQIHIIQIQEINYIEACGDYVSVFTATGSFLKEQTMKYFEENLPSKQFVRIHRSLIVNVSEVSKIELYEKESYRVHLKNGKILKASSGGYKALKEMIRL